MFTYIVPIIGICSGIVLLFFLMYSLKKMFFDSQEIEYETPPKPTIKPRFDEAEEKFLTKYLNIVSETFELYFNEYPLINDNIKNMVLHDKKIKLMPYGVWDGEPGYICHEVPSGDIRNHGVVAVHLYFNAAGEYKEHAELIYRLKDSVIKSLKKRIPQNADSNIMIFEMKGLQCLRVKFLWRFRAREEDEFSYQKDDIDFKLLEKKEMYKRRKEIRMGVAPDVLAKKMLRYDIKSFKKFGYDEPYFSIRETYDIFVDVASWEKTIYIAKILENNDILQKSKQRNWPRKINMDLAQKFLAGEIEVKF